MKNWFRRNGGYLGAGLSFILGLSGFTAFVLAAEGLIESFLCILCGVIGVTLGSFSAMEQLDKNKHSVIINKNDLKFEDKTQDDYSKEHQIESKVRYTKNYIIEESKSNDKEDDLNI